MEKRALLAIVLVLGLGFLCTAAESGALIPFRLLDEHTETTTSIAFSLDGKVLASASADGTVRLWDVSTGERVLALELSYGIHCVVFSPDGKLLACAGERIELVDVSTGEVVRAFDGQPGVVLSAAFSPNGALLASGGLPNLLGERIALWDVATGTRLGSLTDASYSTYVLPVTSVAFSPNGIHLVSGSYEGLIELWDVSKGMKLRTLNSCGVGAGTLSVAFVAGGKALAGQCGYGVMLWETEEWSILSEVSTNQGFRSIAFSPNGRLFALGSEGGALTLWDIAAGQLLWTVEELGPAFPVAFSSDGKLLASALLLSGGIQLWSVWSSD